MMENGTDGESELGPNVLLGAILQFYAKNRNLLYRFAQRTENSRTSSNSSTGSCHVFKHLVYRFITLLEHCSYKFRVR